MITNKSRAVLSDLTYVKKYFFHKFEFIAGKNQIWYIYGY